MRHVANEQIIRQYTAERQKQLSGGHYEWRPAMCWDTFTYENFGLTERQLKLFGKTNLGTDLTNLQVPETLAADQVFYAISWWIEAAAGTSNSEGLRNFLLTLYVGDKPCQQAFGNMLLRPMPVVRVIPCRQTFRVEVMKLGPTPLYGPIRVCINGFQVRTHA